MKVSIKRKDGIIQGYNVKTRKPQWSLKETASIIEMIKPKDKAKLKSALSEIIIKQRTQKLSETETNQILRKHGVKPYAAIRTNVQTGLRTNRR